MKKTLNRLLLFLLKKNLKPFPLFSADAAPPSRTIGSYIHRCLELVSAATMHECTELALAIEEHEPTKGRRLLALF